jgi:RNA polymerase sigma-70 factor (ECF subfamily)
MAQIGLDSQRMILFGTSSPNEYEPVAGFEEVALPLLDSLYNLARWLVRNQNDAEDLVQETYLKALRGFSPFQPGTNFRAWMYGILRNTFLTSRTGLRLASTLPLESEDDGPELAVESETPETILMGQFSFQLLQSAIDDLPVHYRETLLLCDVEEMSYREIAEILSIPIGTVMSRLARARKVIRESLRSAPVQPESRDVFDHRETHGKGTCSHRRLSCWALPIS